MTTLSDPYRNPQPFKQPLQLSLFSILTLCCACFRLKGRNGRWTRRIVHQDNYPRTEFSHGICPACFKQLYPAAYRHREGKKTEAGSRKISGQDMA
jgi:hypothetical protein